MKNMKNVMVILAFALAFTACKSDKDKQPEATGGAAGVPSAEAGSGGSDAGSGGTNSTGGDAGQAAADGGSAGE